MTSKLHILNIIKSNFSTVIIHFHQFFNLLRLKNNKEIEELVTVPVMHDDVIPLLM